MKKLILWLLVLTLVPVVAFADQLSDLEAQIDAMLRQISTLQQSLNQGTNTPPPASSNNSNSSATSSGSCNALAAELGPGARNASVVTLQVILRSLGYFTYPENTGYYGQVTVAAVQAFQRASGIISNGNPATTGYGRVGPRTRAAINARGCGGSGDLSENTPIPVGSRYQVKFISPSAGQDFLRGTKKLVHWYAGAYVGQVNIYAVKSGATTNAATVASNINVRSSFLFWTVPSSLATGVYRLTIIPVGKTQAIATSETFDVIGGSSSGGGGGGGSSGGGSVTPGVAVADPDGGEDYTIGEDITVKWTDGNEASRYDLYLLKGSTIKKTLEDVNPSASGSKLVGSITTSGTVAGSDYKIKVCRANTTTCDSSNSSFTLALQPNSLTVFNPMADTVLTLGQSTQIRWKDASSETQVEYDLDIVDRTPGYSGLGTITPILSNGSRRVSSTIAADDITRTYSWTVARPAVSPANGVYGIRVCRPNQVPCAQSPNFTIGGSLSGITCSASPTAANLQNGSTTINWTVGGTTAGQTYVYNWTGADSLSGMTNPVSKKYTTSGTKTAQVGVRETPSGKTGQATCSVTIGAEIPVGPGPATVTIDPVEDPMIFLTSNWYREISWNQSQSDINKLYNIWLSNANWPGAGGSRQFILDQKSTATTKVTYRWYGEYYDGTEQKVTPAGTGFYFRVCPADGSKLCKDSSRFEIIRR